MSDEIVDSGSSSMEPSSLQGSSGDEAFDEEADNILEQAPEYDGIPHDEVVHIMEIIRGWQEAHGLAYTMWEVLREYGPMLNVQHIEYDPERSAREWFDLFSEAHDRDLYCYNSLLMIHVRAFLANLISHSEV